MTREAVFQPLTPPASVLTSLPSWELHPWTGEPALLALLGLALLGLSLGSIYASTTCDLNKVIRGEG